MIPGQFHPIRSAKAEVEMIARYYSEKEQERFTDVFKSIDRVKHLRLDKPALEAELAVRVLKATHIAREIDEQRRGQEDHSGDVEGNPSEQADPGIAAEVISDGEQTG